jgi:hypothetical protein
MKKVSTTAVRKAITPLWRNRGRYSLFLDAHVETGDC